MHNYRLYVYNAEGKLIAPVMMIFAEDDEAATDWSLKLFNTTRPPALMRLYGP